MFPWMGLVLRRRRVLQRDGDKWGGGGGDDRAAGVGGCLGPGVRVVEMPRALWENSERKVGSVEQGHRFSPPLA